MRRGARKHCRDRPRCHNFGHSSRLPRGLLSPDFLRSETAATHHAVPRLAFPGAGAAGTGGGVVLVARVYLVYQRGEFTAGRAAEMHQCENVCVRVPACSVCVWRRCTSSSFGQGCPQLPSGTLPLTHPDTRAFTRTPRIGSSDRVVAPEGCYARANGWDQGQGRLGRLGPRGRGREERGKLKRCCDAAQLVDEEPDVAGDPRTGKSGRDCAVEREKGKHTHAHVDSRECA